MQRCFQFISLIFFSIKNISRNFNNEDFALPFTSPSFDKYVIINDKLNETISNIENIIKYNQLKDDLLNKVKKNLISKK